MICSQIYTICMNVEMCEMCRPDTHALSYGFSVAELDFIINYDIKYRMGKELNSGEDNNG